MVIFRVDANSMIGKGHMKRCIAIAKAIKLLGGKVYFVTREDSDISILQANYMEFRTIPSMTLGSEKSIASLKEIIVENNAGVCVVDSYDVSNVAFNSLREVCKVILIEDFLYDVYDVDCVVNYNIYVEKLDYLAKYPSSTQLLLGIDYAPYGGESYSRRRLNINNDVSSILVYPGELDSHELAPGIVDSLLDCIDDNVRLRVVAGKNAVTRDILYKMSNSSSQIIIEPDISNIGKILNMCDIAVTVADSLCYDLLSFSVPSCVFLSDYSQNMLFSGLVSKELMVSGGDYVNRSNKFYGDLVCGVTSLAYENQRVKLCDNISGLNLGNGAQNLAKAILDYE
ncbi:MAG: hypothetical protein K6G75_07875 [Lachnospiraceae bacterium]|nr:hypothetical protein [Lachnospiraceae bacterium]